MLKFNTFAFKSIERSLIKKLSTQQTLIGVFKFGTEVKKDSKWIYSSKYDEMEAMKKGKIFITTDPGLDTHDVTLRMYKALLQDSQLIFSHYPQQTRQILKSLVEKKQFIDSANLHNKQKQKISQQSQQNLQNQGTSLVAQIKDTKYLTKDKQLKYQQQLSSQYAIEMSKHLDMQIDMEKILQTKKDPTKKLLAQKQQQLRQYLKNRQFRSQLQTIKNARGYPQVYPLPQTEEDLKYFWENGINATYVLSEFGISDSHKLFSILQQSQVPYEILPGKNQLVNAIVLSGFPADRFSIEYFPNDLEGILFRRKKSKLTVAMVIQFDNLQKTIEVINNIYGKSQKIFVQNGKNPFRSQIFNFYDYLSQNQLQKDKYVKIIISPYISQFNDVLKQQKDEISRIFGEAQAQQTNFLDLQVLQNKLTELQKKQYTHQIDLFSMTTQMLERLKDQELIRNSLKSMIGINDQQADILIQEGKKRVKIDYLGISDFKQHRR